jgi:hypothetical protein
MLFEFDEEKKEKIINCVEDIYPLIMKHGHEICISSFYHILCTFIATSSNPQKLTDEFINGLRFIPKDMMKEIERMKKEENEKNIL